jgi:CheY-like chemotaxis protein
VSVQPPNVFLIVENDPNDAFLIRRALAASPNFNASFLCRNPSEAKAYLTGAGMYSDRQRYPLPTVVITDLRMETEFGTELVAWIREQAAPIRCLKVVILTGSASEVQWEAAQKVGAEKLFRKPGRLEDLQSLVLEIANEFSPSNEPDRVER